MFGGGIWPAIVHKGGDGEPTIPVILSGQGIEVEILFHPLVFVLCESVSLWVKSHADVLSYAQFCSEGLWKVQGEVGISVWNDFRQDSKPREEVLKVE